jgi:hypothetical protein
MVPAGWAAVDDIGKTLDKPELATLHAAVEV